MDVMKQISTVIGQLIDIGIALLALAIVLQLLVGGTLPFFGQVVSNITGLVADLGTQGLVGLIVLGVILWLFAKYAR